MTQRLRNNREITINLQRQHLTNISQSLLLIFLSYTWLTGFRWYCCISGDSTHINHMSRYQTDIQQIHHSISPHVKFGRFRDWATFSLVHLLTLLCITLHVKDRKHRGIFPPSLAKWAPQPHVTGLLTLDVKRKFIWLGVILGSLTEHKRPDDYSDTAYTFRLREEVGIVNDLSLSCAFYDVPAAPGHTHCNLYRTKTGLHSTRQCGLRHQSFSLKATSRSNCMIPQKSRELRRKGCQVRQRKWGGWISRVPGKASLSDLRNLKESTIAICLVIMSPIISSHFQTC